MPPGLDPTERRAVIEDFERANIDLITTYTMKCTFWQEPPWVVSAVAHRDPRIRARALEKCLRSDSPHPRIVQLKQGTLFTQARTLVEAGGVWPESHSEMPALKKLAIEYRLMFSSEWRVEGQHERTKQGVTRAPCHS